MKKKESMPQDPPGAGLVAEVRRKLGLGRKAFARLTGYSERAIANWESGARPDEPGLRRVRETERFQERLAEVVRPEAIPEWLDTPNDAFDGLKPLEVIERGEIDPPLEHDPLPRIRSSELTTARPRAAARSSNSTCSCASVRLR
jgi:transcriptional regulator with XRE-family HTH domain